MGQSTSDLQAIVAGELATYDPPTRAELTTDKAAIIAEVDANETKIDALTLLLTTPPSVDVENSPFDEILIENAVILLDERGIEGIYRPGYLNRVIQVIIRYNMDDGQVAPVVRHRSPIVNIKVANDSVTGISANEFEQGQIINIPPRKGADARDFNMARILKQDAGMITIEVH